MFSTEKLSELEFLGPKILTYIYLGQTFFGAKSYSDPNLSDLKFLSTQIFFLNILELKLFLSEKNFESKEFGVKIIIFIVPTFLNKQFVGQILIYLNSLRDKMFFFNQKLFLPKNFWDKHFFDQNFCYQMAATKGA